MKEDAAQRSTTATRKPWVALALSLATPGLGHLYCGRLLKGVMLVAAVSLTAPVWIVASYAPPTSALLICVLVLIPGVIAVYAYTLLDAYRLARREGMRYRLRGYNRAAAYALFFVAAWLIPGGLSHTVRPQGFQAFYVVGSTMYPTLRRGDYVLANKRIFSDRTPRPGDVAVFRNPENAAQLKIKRVIAGPGDTVEIRADRVYINGTILGYSKGTSEAEHDENATGLHERQGDAVYSIFLDQLRAGEDLDETSVPSGHYFLLGDNRTKSRDSRHFGPVAEADIIGAVHYIYVPGDFVWDRFGALAGSRL